MINFIKSELYRVFHTKGFYLFTGFGVVMVLAMNLVLWMCGLNTPEFRYNTTGFAFSMLYYGGFQPILFMTLGISTVIFSGEFKNKTINNSIAFGCSAKTHFIGKLLVTLLCSLIRMLVTEGTLIGSGYLLLQDSGPAETAKVIKATIACTPILICSVCAAVSLFYILRSEVKGMWAWLVLIIGVTAVITLFGMKFEPMRQLSRWLIYNLVVENSMDPATGMTVMVWETSEGFYRCILAGVIGILVFVTAGLAGVYKRDLK